MIARSGFLELDLRNTPARVPAYRRAGWYGDRVAGRGQVEVHHPDEARLERSRRMAHGEDAL